MKTYSKAKLDALEIVCRDLLSPGNDDINNIVQQIAWGFIQLKDECHFLKSQVEYYKQATGDYDGNEEL